MTFVRFFSGNDIKERLFMENSCEVEIELIVELQINRWTDRNNRIHADNQAVIQEFECKKSEEEDIWKIFD